MKTLTVGAKFWGGEAGGARGSSNTTHTSRLEGFRGHEAQLCYCEVNCWSDRLLWRKRNSGIRTVSWRRRSLVVVSQKFWHYTLNGALQTMSVLATPFVSQCVKLQRLGESPAEWMHSPDNLFPGSWLLWQARFPRLGSRGNRQSLSDTVNRGKQSRERVAARLEYSRTALPGAQQPVWDGNKRTF